MRTKTFQCSAARYRSAVLVAAAMAAPAVPAVAGTNPGMVTISTSGSTAFRSALIGTSINSSTGNVGNPNFGLTFLNTPAFGQSPSTALNTINFGGVTYPDRRVDGTVAADPLDFWNTGGQSFQFAPRETTRNTTSGTAQDRPVVRFEWHEQGSVEGIFELVDDQIRVPAGQSRIVPVTGNAIQVGRTQSAANPVWVNRNRFTAAASTTVNGFTLEGFGGPQGQSAVQLAFSDVNATQGFSRAGTGGFNRTPLQAGYGKGNPALSAGTNLNGLGEPGRRQQFSDQSELGTGVGGSGTDRLENRTVAIQATLFVANPGTGLTRVDRTDAQWLQTTGRLQNGADFNSSTRDAFSGTRNVAALTTGVDPSWASGEGDSATGVNAEREVGPRMRFSGKTSGGSQLRETVQNSRMSVGTLSLSDAVGAADVTNNFVTRPIRGLDYKDGDKPAAGSFVRASAATIVDGTFVIYQNQTVVSVKETADAGGLRVAGDAGNNARSFRDNVTKSIGNFPGSNVANPADQLLAFGYVLPTFTAVQKTFNEPGVGSPRPPGTAADQYNATRSGQFLGSSNLTAPFNVADPTNTTAGNNSVYGNRTGTGSIPVTGENFFFGDFDRQPAAGGVSGVGVRDFSDLDVARRAQAALNGTGSNSMFDTSAPLPSSGQFPLRPDNSTVTVNRSTFAEINRSTDPTRGDLIVMGDFDSDGDFDGEDLRRMARGTSLADSRTSTTLGGGAAGFADSVRSATVVLRKNAALDQLQTATANFAANPASAAQRTSASADAAVDPTGANAFNKADVNRDGRVNRVDAQLVDYFVTKDYRVLDDQLGAVGRVQAGGFISAFVAPNGAPLNPSDPANASIDRRPLSLVDVELNDTGTITNTVGADGTATSDFRVIRDVLGSALLGGDADFSGTVDVSDLGILGTFFNLASGAKWSLGDFNQDGAVDVSDLGELGTNFNLSSDNPPTPLGVGDKQFLLALAEFPELEAAYVAAVPEPGSAAVVGLAAVGLLTRRRRAARA